MLQLCTAIACELAAAVKQPLRPLTGRANFSHARTALCAFSQTQMLAFSSPHDDLWVNDFAFWLHGELDLCAFRATLPATKVGSSLRVATLRMQLQSVFHGSSLSTLDPGSGR